METILKILQQFGLRNTDCRSAILEAFLMSNFALTNADIELKLAQNFDRVTVYRTLKIFLNKGIIHKVLDDLGSPKYALCKEYCTTHHHNHSHVHFKCNVCGQTNCLDDVKIPSVQLPQGYTLSESNFLISGVCDNCNQVPIIA
jgi:Fur family transcriptional regulator, ferric uptake regulator